jgi:carbon-monoxide dehydrogenase large subunit
MSDVVTGGKFIGQSIPRIEDDRLLMGNGRYVGDIQFPNMLHVAFVRSPHAHALIRKIEVDDALAIPGVFSVVAAADMQQMLAQMRMPLGFRRPSSRTTSHLSY